MIRLLVVADAVVAIGATSLVLEYGKGEWVFQDDEVVLCVCG